ncbi:MAG: two-component system regulatory protein YycI [Eubacteriales bacterium]|nr:two-component system regulatory protein YycI [Eubacteriales bacterium]
MDWTKAKTILIVALMITNLVLITAYFFHNNSLKEDEREMQEVTIRLLEDKNIYIQTDIPQGNHRMPKLTVRYDKTNENIVEEQLAKQIAQTDTPLTEEALIDMTTEFIKACELMNEHVTFDRIDRARGETRVTYKNYLDRIAIEDSYITCTVKDGKIVDFDRFWLEPVEVNDIEKEVIPAVAALIKFMSENKEGEKIYVQDISLVYWLDSGTFDTEYTVTDTAFPAWKITYNRGKIQYVLAWEQ